jgi:hypothetical protein
MLRQQLVMLKRLESLALVVRRAVAEQAAGLLWVLLAQVPVLLEPVFAAGAAAADHLGAEATLTAALVELMGALEVTGERLAQAQEA